jgi:hypothetical protein
LLWRLAQEVGRLLHLLSAEEALRFLSAVTLNLFRSFGDEEDAARRSLGRMSGRALA